MARNAANGHLPRIAALARKVDAIHHLRIAEPFARCPAGFDAQMDPSGRIDANDSAISGEASGKVNTLVPRVEPHPFIDPHRVTTSGCNASRHIAAVSVKSGR